MDRGPAVRAELPVSSAIESMSIEDSAHSTSAGIKFVLMRE